MDRDRLQRSNQASQDDIESLFRFFQSRYGIMLGIARRYAPVLDLANDIVHQVFIDFLENVKKEKWDLQHDIMPMLCTITKRRAIQCWQKHQKESSRLLQAVDERLMAAYQKEPLEEWEKMEEELAALRDCMTKLPNRSRTLLQKHYIEGNTMESIAEDEQRPSSAVRQIFHRIRVQLRQCIEKALHD